MTNPYRTRDPGRAALLLVGAGLALAVPLVWLWVQEHDPAPPIPAAAPIAARSAGTGTELPTAGESEARVALVRSSAPAQAEEAEEPAPVHGARSDGSKKEREYYNEFLALERSSPGALDARARELVESAAPAGEKVALMRAACAMETPHAAEWLELAVRTPEAGVPRGGTIASFALELLGRRASNHEQDCRALERLCLEQPLASLALRRRATAKFAAAADEDGLVRLAGALMRENDELVIASALSSLQGRKPTPAAQRILDQWPERAAKAAIPDPPEGP